MVIKHWPVELLELDPSCAAEFTAEVAANRYDFTVCLFVACLLNAGCGFAARCVIRILCSSLVRRPRVPTVYCDGVYGARSLYDVLGQDSHADTAGPAANDGRVRAASTTCTAAASCTISRA